MYCAYVGLDRADVGGGSSRIVSVVCYLLSEIANTNSQTPGERLPNFMNVLTRFWLNVFGRLIFGSLESFIFRKIEILVGVARLSLTSCLGSLRVNTLFKLCLLRGGMVADC